jgi:hypothetical protein
MLGTDVARLEKLPGVLGVITAREAGEKAKKNRIGFHMEESTHSCSRV